jgi:hypothetical protein
MKRGQKKSESIPGVQINIYTYDVREMIGEIISVGGTRKIIRIIVVEVGVRRINRIILLLFF